MTRDINPPRRFHNSDCPNTIKGRYLLKSLPEVINNLSSEAQAVMALQWLYEIDAESDDRFAEVVTRLAELEYEHGRVHVCPVCDDEMSRGTRDAYGELVKLPTDPGGVA